MVKPVTEHAAQQVGTSKEWTVSRRCRAKGEMVPAAGPAMASVEHELFGAQPALARVLIERGCICDQLGPAMRRMDVYFDHAGVGRDAELVDSRVQWRRISFDHHRHL